MYKNLNLSRKIGLGFSLVILLILIVSAISFAGIKTASSGFSEYRNLARDSNLSGQLQSNMLMARMNVKDYLITHNEKDIEQYNTYLNTMHDLLEQAKVEIQKPERAQLVQEVENQIVNYENAFKQTVNLINTRNEIVSTQLDPNGQQMRKAMTDIILSAYQDNDASASYMAAQVQEKLLLGRLYVAKYLKSNLQEDFDFALQNMNSELNKVVVQLDQNLQNPRRRLLFSQFKNAHSLYINAMNKINEMIVQRNDLIHNTLDIIGPIVAKKAQDIKHSVMSEQDALGPSLEASNQTTLNLISIKTILALIISIFCSYFIARSITRPINRVVDIANKLAQGDLTLKIEQGSKDEIGQLFNALGNTVNKLRDIVGQISGASIEVSSSAAQLSVVTEQSSLGAKDQKSETVQVATAMVEMAATVQDVASIAVQAANAASHADNEANNGRKIVEKTLQTISQLSSVVDTTSQRLVSLEADSVSIGEILDVINDIADQTNLLALNAAIEAARAGDQGRGFSVVADEVRNLAQRTQESTLQIKTLIEKLQSGAKNAVKSMSLGKEHAQSSVIEASKAKTALNSITQAVTHINDMNAQIASATEQQSIVTNDVSKNVTNVQLITDEGETATLQISQSSTELALLSGKLKSMIDHFKVDEMKQGN